MPTRLLQCGSRQSAAHLLMSLLFTLSAAASAQEGMEDVTIESIRVAEGVYMLTGRGGNIGVSTGPDGVIVIDDQFAPLSEKILAAIRVLDEGPLRFVVNTHWHGDHTGGNENLGKAGAIIVAHENVRARMSTEQFMASFNRTVPASPEAALPVITFTDAVSFHWNGDDIDVFHVPAAHTDGDAIIHFKKANVVHTGDVYFNQAYPFIDAGSGGTVAGVLAAVDRLLALGDDATRFIPGHGTVSGKTGLAAYRSMLQTMSERIDRLIDEGLDRDAVIAARPSRDYDAVWGNGFLKPDDWVGVMYDALTAVR